MFAYPLSPSLIKSIRRQLLSLSRGATKSPGEFKKELNYVGDRAYRKIRFVRFLHSSHLSLFNAASSPTRRGQ